MRVVIRAFNSDGYHRDILTMNQDQVTMSDTRLKEPEASIRSGLIGHGIRIDPKEFPEAEYFEVVIPVGRDK